MSTCHFCGADNEDWMKICQECGNPVIDSSKNKDGEDNDNDNNFETSFNDDEETKPAGTKNLIIALAVLSVILVALTVYTIFIVL